jgi:uncharacterized protein (DUF2141 family)
MLMTAILFPLLMMQPAQAELKISFSNLKEAKGQLYVAVYATESDFLNTDRVYAKQIVPVKQAGNLEMTFALPPGKYAVSCFHDVNGNGKLDTNLVGIPSEPYGFSNNARPRFRPPYWSEASFSVSGGTIQLPVSLDTW